VKIFKLVFPAFPVALLLYTQLVGICMNYDLFDSREFLILFCWIPLFTFPYALSGKRVFYYIALSFCFLESFLGLVHWLILKGPLTASSLFILLNTNSSEAFDFVVLKFDWSLFLLLPYMVLTVLGWRKIPPFSENNRKYWFIAPVLIIGSVFIVENAQHERLVRKGLPQSTRALVSFFEEIKVYQNLKRREVMNLQVSGGKDSSVFVLIIGESLNRNHMSLYGYSQKTSPFLDKRNDLAVFTNVVSGYSNTLNAVLSALSESNLENKQSVDKSISLIDVFHSAGYKTFWLSNQSPIGVWDNGVFNLAKGCDVIDYVNINANSSADNIHTRSYDEKLLTPFEKALSDASSKKFIVLHLMGNHAGYVKRYPDKFNVFNNQSSAESELISEYDNAVLYNDSIVNVVLEKLSGINGKKSRHVAAIYFSDHGENVFDENHKVGHDYSGNLPKANVEIPFIFWSLDTVKINAMKLLTSRPFVSDDLFHAVLDINGLGVKGYEPSRSVFNPDFNSGRKRVLEDGYNYDRER